MGLGRWMRFFKFFVVTLVFLVLTAFSAYGADNETLDRLEKIIKQQQAQIEAQQKALEELQVEVQTVKDQTATTKVAAATESPVAVKPGNPKANLKLYGQVNKAVLYSMTGTRATLTWWITTTHPPASVCWVPSSPAINMKSAPSLKWSTKPTPATWSAKTMNESAAPVLRNGN